MSSLPDDLFLELLTRLPIKTLLRFRSVSKSWRSLIDSRSFARMHLNYQLKQATSNSDNSCIFLSCLSCYRPAIARLAAINFNSYGSEETPLPSVDYYSRYGSINLLGSCNGLLCLLYPEKNLLVLWNPSIRKYLELPPSPQMVSDQKSFGAYGFGYNETSDDYKVVRIGNIFKENDGIYVQHGASLYSVKQKQWKKIDDSAFPLAKLVDNGVLVSSALHWVAYGRKSITAFDLAAEKFRQVALPVERRSVQIIGVLENCLSYTCPGPASSYDIWVMKIYGKHDSWMKIIRMETGGLSRGYANPRPIGYIKRGREIIMEGGFMPEFIMFYDTEKKSIVKSFKLPDRVSPWLLYIRTLEHLEGMSSRDMAFLPCTE